MAAKQEALKLGLPKGSLQEFTFRIFEKAGFDINQSPRRYQLDIDDPEIDAVLLRPQEIPSYVEQGKLDAGISGQDWILESGADVVMVCDLLYAKESMQKVSWVLAVAQDSDIKAPEDLKNKKISTELVNLTKKYFQEKNIEVEVEFSWGASEAKPPRFADAIVDLTETGTSLQANNLRILDTVLESSTQLIANQEIWKNEQSKKKISSLAVLLKRVVEAQEAVKLMMHVPVDKVDEILKALPQLKPITAVKIAAEPWYDVSMVCRGQEARSILPQLKRMGCEDLIQFPITGVKD